jgi:hypothetical protein
VTFHVALPYLGDSTSHNVTFPYLSNVTFRIAAIAIAIAAIAIATGHHPGTT